MTNSHNRSGKNGSYAERYFNNHSPQQLGGSGGKRHNSTGNSGGNGGRGQKSPSSTYFRSLSTSGAIPIAKSSSPVSSKGGNYYSTSSPSGRNNSFNLNASYQRSSPGGGNFNTSLGSYPGTLSGSPPNFSHFAGSKCYDAPAPTALPKPPVHWTSPVSSTTASTVASALTTTSKTSINNCVGGSKTVPIIKATSPPASSSSRSKAKSVKLAMSCAAAAAKINRSVDFTHNLKMVLNVQA